MPSGKKGKMGTSCGEVSSPVVDKISAIEHNYQESTCRTKKVTPAMLYLLIAEAKSVFNYPFKLPLPGCLFLSPV